MRATNGIKGAWLKRIVADRDRWMRETQRYVAGIVRQARKGDLLAILNLPSQREVRQLDLRLKRLETKIGTLQKTTHHAAS